MHWRLLCLTSLERLKYHAWQTRFRRHDFSFSFEKEGVWKIASHFLDWTFAGLLGQFVPIFNNLPIRSLIKAEHLLALTHKLNPYLTYLALLSFKYVNWVNRGQSENNFDKWSQAIAKLSRVGIWTTMGSSTCRVCRLWQEFRIIETEQDESTPIPVDGHVIAYF